MLRQELKPPLRILMTLDAVGGVWRYAVDAAHELERLGVNCTLVGFGPEPDAAQRSECDDLDLIWTQEKLDWNVADDTMLDKGPEILTAIAHERRADLLHLNVPSQAAGLPNGIPAIVASHSCVPTWWQAVHNTHLPHDWTWQHARNHRGFQRADAILAPSESHARALRQTYGPLKPLQVVYNAVEAASANQPKQELILAVGRWWDAGKNGQILDSAAAFSPWPIVLAGPLDRPNHQRAAFRNVQTIGSLPHKAILSLMQRAAVFAAPSRYEPFGLAVAEAATSGAALVLADIPTFRELWHGAALFVDVNDAKAWVDAFATIAADKTLRYQLAAKARCRARKFSLPRQGARLHQLYSAVVSSAQAA